MLFAHCQLVTHRGTREERGLGLRASGAAHLSLVLRHPSRSRGHAAIACPLRLLYCTHLPHLAVQVHSPCTCAAFSSSELNEVALQSGIMRVLPSILPAALISSRALHGAQSIHRLLEIDTTIWWYGTSGVRVGDVYLSRYVRIHRAQVVPTYRVLHRQKERLLNIIRRDVSWNPDVA